MQNNTIINGELTFNGNKCAFSFNDNILMVYCLKGEAKHLLWEEHKGINGLSFRSVKKDIAADKLEGIIFDSKEKRIVFYIHKNGYGYKGGLDSEKIILKINVSKYIIETSGCYYCNQIVLGSKQYHKFLNLYPNYVLNNKYEDKLSDVLFDSSSYYDKAEFIYDGHKYLIHPNAAFSGGGTKFVFIPELIIEPEYELSVDEFVFITDIIIKMIMILFMRNNIFPDYIKYIYKDKQYDLYYTLDNNYIHEIEDVNSYLSRGFIAWKTILPFIQKVLDDIIEKTIDSRYLGNESKYRLFIDSNKISSYSAFFENTYSLIYGDEVKHKSSSQKEIDYIKNNLNSIKIENKKSLNSKIDYLISQLDHIALSTKIQKVFKDYNGCLSVVKNELQLKNYSDIVIAKDCANLRNWTDHGDKKAKIDEYIASCFAFLSCAIYAMFMRRWGMKDDDIKVELKSLYMLHL